MTAHLDSKRLAELRTAAEVGIRMSSGFGPHTVQVRPAELAALVEEVHIARAQERPHADVACRKCGCTDADCSGCIARTGSSCYWVERDLCSACSGDEQPAHIAVEHLARGLAVRHGSPGALIMMLDAGGGLHIGCAAVDHPITERFVTVARSVDIACERGEAGFQTISRDKAVEIAQRCAKAKPKSYYAEPFEPHEWVVDAILLAASSLPPAEASCVHCKQVAGSVTDIDAIREHSMTCSKSPVVQELQRLRAERDDAIADMEAAEQRMLGVLDGTFAVGDGSAQREIERLRRITDQAETVARHWDAQDGINGAELDKLRDIVFDRPEPA